MSLPRPVPGLLIGYAYLWRDEYEAGRDEGVKARPVAIVAAVESVQGETRVLVLPVTHAAPRQGDTAIETPPAVKRRLGLDPERFWIVLTEYNDFVWPGPDLRPVPSAHGKQFGLGLLPPTLFAAVRDGFAAIARRGLARRVPRD